MLKIRDNNISFNRGESVCIEMQILMQNGIPLILPYSNGKSTIAVFTVKSAINEPVLTKYLDLQSPPIYSGFRDDSEFGYCKFTTQNVLEFDNLTAMYDAFGFSPDVNGNNTVVDVSDSIIAARQRVAYLKDNGYYCYIETDTGGRVTAYDFTIQLPLLPNDTAELDSKMYLYDLAVYITEQSIEDISENGIISPVYKIQLIPPHKFILEDSNNV